MGNRPKRALVATGHGPVAYENWRAAKRGAPVAIACEYPLMSDARFSQQIVDGLGPYQLLSPVSITGDEVAPALWLREDQHEVAEPSGPGAADMPSAPGGSGRDEIAALLSLCLGVRLRGAGPARVWSPGCDARGSPYSWPEPTLSVAQRRHVRNRMLPRARGAHTLEGAVRLPTFAELLPAEAAALVRAATLYQDALWMAESEPDLSWLLLVQAAETTANCWHTGTTPALLRSSKPELARYLDALGGGEAVSRVAKEFAHLLRSQARFVGFLLAFMPAPPPDRPPAQWQAVWEPAPMEAAFKVIYDRRSRWVHDGVVFPHYMSMPPLGHPFEETVRVHPDDPRQVRSRGHGPLLALYVFEYVVRGAVLGWWEAAVPRKQGSRRSWLPRSSANESMPSLGYLRAPVRAPALCDCQTGSWAQKGP